MEAPSLTVLGPYNVGEKEERNETIPEKPNNSLRFVCMSDTHCTVTPESIIPMGDVFIHCGDFTQSSLEPEYEKFFKFLESLPHKHKIVIGGNHDVVLDTLHYKKSWNKIMGHKVEVDSMAIIEKLKNRCTYLIEESVEIEGIKIFGTPYTRGNSADWGFGFLGERGTAHWNKISRDTDILISHSPPFGILDSSMVGSHIGCACLLDQVTTKIKPKVHVFGHVHESYGFEQKGSILFINAAIVNKFRKPTHYPVVFDIVK